MVADPSQPPSRWQYNFNAQGVSQASYNGHVIVDGTTTNVSPPRPLLVIDGDDLSATPTLGTTGPTQVWWLSAVWRLFYPYVFGGNVAVAGATAASALANFDTNVAPLKPNEVWLLIGRNDMTTGNVAGALAAVDLYAAKCVAIGATLWICTVPPGSGAVWNTALIQQSLVAFNDGLVRRSLAGEFLLADLYSAIVDMTSVAGAGLANAVAANGYNPTDFGQELMGQAFAAKRVTTGGLTQWQSFGASLINVRSAANQNSTWLLNNPTWTGSGGTASGTGSANVTGSKPTSWNFANDTELTVALNRVTTTSSGFQQPNLQMTFGGTLTAPRSLLVQQTMANLTTMGIVPGVDSVSFAMWFTSAFTTAVLTACFVELQLWDATMTTMLFDQVWAGAQFTPQRAMPAAGTMFIPPVLIPVGAVIPVIQMGVTFGVGTATNSWTLGAPTLQVHQPGGP